MRCLRRLAGLLLFTLAARPGLGQSEDALRAAFEGKMVRVMIEMPGSNNGVDLRMGSAQPMDFSEYAGRLKRFGTAYRPGDIAMVTKVHISGDHIEFQLGGGGFGTAGDDTYTSLTAPVATKTQREKDLERDIKTEQDQKQKARMNDDLDRLRSDREREDNRNAVRAAEAQAIKEETLRQRRLDGGSRFNVRYDHNVPASAMVPDALMAGLAKYIDFSGAPATDAAPARAAGEIKKGMLVAEMDAMLGRPESIRQRTEGSLEVSTSVYRTRDRKVTVDFVEGVVVRFVVGGV